MRLLPFETTTIRLPQRRFKQRCGGADGKSRAAGSPAIAYRSS
jgi:hypothetical protein